MKEKMKEIYEALDWWVRAGKSNIPYENQYISKTYDGNYVIDTEAILEDVHDLLKSMSVKE